MPLGIDPKSLILGILLGWLVLPALLAMIAGKRKAAAA